MAKVKDQAKIRPEEKLADLENKWKRALADYQNLEKRVEKERVCLYYPRTSNGCGRFHYP